MRFPNSQIPSIEQQTEFLRESKYGLLSAFTGSRVVSGIQNFFLLDGIIHVHLGKTDEQNSSMAKECHFSIHKQYSMIPSHWIDKNYGGAANMCFKYQEYYCEISKVKSKREKNKLFNTMMEHFLIKGTWAPVEKRSDLYEKKIINLIILKLTPVQTRAKWNFIQGKTLRQKKSVIKNLRRRNEILDIETANLIKSFIN